MARPMKCSSPRSGRIAGLGEGRPGRRRNLAGLDAAHAEQQPGFLERLADSGKRERLRLGGARALQALHQVRLSMGIERPRHRHQPVGGIDPAAGKDVASRHEFVALMALAEQDLRHRAGAVDQDQRRGILRPHIRRREVALDLVHPLDEAGHSLGTVGNARRSSPSFLALLASRGGCWDGLLSRVEPAPAAGVVIAALRQKLESQRAGDRRRFDQAHGDADRRGDGSRRCDRRPGHADPRDSGNIPRRRWCAPE